MSLLVLVAGDKLKLKERSVAESVPILRIIWFFFSGFGFNVDQN